MRKLCTYTHIGRVTTLSVVQNTPLPVVANALPTVLKSREITSRIERIDSAIPRVPSILQLNKPYLKKASILECSLTSGTEDDPSKPE